MLGGAYIFTFTVKNSNRVRLVVPLSQCFVDFGSVQGFVCIGLVCYVLFSSNYLFILLFCVSLTLVDRVLFITYIHCILVCS